MERTNSPQHYTNVYAVVNNIPSFYRSADLRRFFSQFVETRGFDCFHFRHRPEKQSVKEQQREASTSVEKHDSSVKSLTAGALKSETFCCIIRLSETKFVELTRAYHQRNWQNSKGESVASKCLISRLKISSQSLCMDLEKDDDSTSSTSSTVPTYQTRGEKRNIPPDREEFREEDLLKIPELRPPTVMPHGNVGTPTMHFIKLIQECRLPPSIIKKLQLDFPKSKNKGKYGNVPFDYHTEVVEAMSHVEAEQSQCVSCDQDCELSTLPTEESVHITKSASNSSCFSENVDASASGTDPVVTRMEPPQPETSPHPTNNSSLDYKEKRRLKKLAKQARRKLMAENIEEKMIAFERGGSGSEDDNDTCEEWERHEAMYDDVTNQGRNKDRLFEEEMEVVWEKGGSGLVFYTDAQYWQEKEGDFDEQTTDDLNVDMSPYYEAGAGDQDIRDFLTIRQEQRRRRGVEKTDRFSAGIGKFEQHTRGFGRDAGKTGLERRLWVGFLCPRDS